MRFCLLLFMFSAPSFSSWESEYPKEVNEFIHQQVHAKCFYADYVDGIIALQVEESTDYSLYTADFSMFGDITEGYIVIKMNAQNNLLLIDLACPQI